jgi:hypothetical protein
MTRLWAAVPIFVNWFVLLVYDPGIMRTWTFSRLIPLVMAIVAPLALTACASNQQKAVTPVASASPKAGSGTPSAPAASGASPNPSGSPGGPKPLPASGGGINSIKMSTTLAADGSAAQPSTLFHSASDTKIYAVLDVKGLPAGTKLAFTRYREGRFVDSRSSMLAHAATYFHFVFTPKAGQTFHIGAYRLRVFVNRQGAAETKYRID